MTALLDYDRQRVLVSGCRSGIGRATAKLLLDLGAEVHGIDLEANELELRSFTATDLHDPHSIESALDKIGGPIHALFNCAGVAPGRPALDVMKVNFIGTRHLTDQVLPLMARGGAIVSVGSLGGAGWSRRLPLLTQLVSSESYQSAVTWCEQHADEISEGYSFSKEALIVWTMRISSELIKRGIRVNCTVPGAVQTPMLTEIETVTPSAVIDALARPFGRRSSAEEQAYPLLMLNSRAATYINGAVLTVDGGHMAARLTGQVDSSSELGRR